jgi:Protein of unknown function (DUF4239)
MDVLPIWVSGLGLAILLPLSVEVGFRVHARMARRPGFPPEGDGRDWATIVSGALTLLALLMSFTVSMAVDRYERRRQIVNDEANAIATTYLRAQLFAPPARDRLSALTARYARDRRSMTFSGDDRRKIARVAAQTQADQAAIWLATRDAVRQRDAGMLTTSLLQSVNQMFELAATRHSVLEARVPARILFMLVLSAVVTAAMVGYGLGASHRRNFAGSTLLFLMMAMTEFLIVDLDRPGSGGVRVSGAPMDRLNASITQWEAVRLATPQTGPDQKEER